MMITLKAAIKPQKVIFIVFVFLMVLIPSARFILSAKTASAAWYQITAHTLTATVRTNQAGADIAAVAATDIAVHARGIAAIYAASLVHR